MNYCVLTKEKLKKSNVASIFGASYVLSFFLSFSLFTLVVHQADLYSILIDEPGFGEEHSTVMNYIADYMNNYEDRFRTFKNGALHSGLIGGFIAMPLIVTNTLFERKGFKYGF